MDSQNHKKHAYYKMVVVFPDVIDPSLQVESEGKLYSLPDDVEMVFPSAGRSWWQVCMDACMVITCSRVRINRVRLPILLVVS